MSTPNIINSTGERWVTDFTHWEVREAPEGKEKKTWEPSGLEEHLSSVRKWQQDETKALWPASNTTMQPGTSPAPHERSRCSSFFFEAVVLINNLSHTTTNPWVNMGNTSLFPSLSFYHKHINICLTGVLRCAARPPGSHQAARTSRTQRPR